MRDIWCTIVVWCARAAWVVLPFTAGTAIADAIDDWANGAASVAALLCWGAWAIGLIALLAPRPWGLTALRIVAPLALAVTIVAIPSTSTSGAVLAAVSAALATALACSSPVARTAANALAYGDETRFPLHIPTLLLVLPMPLAIAAIGFAVATGPILLGAGEMFAGLVALGALAIVPFVVRSLHALSRRWLVLVPAGAVIVDPLILLDPILMRREQIERVRRSAVADVRAGALDLRVGAVTGSVTITLREPVAVGRRQGRTSGSLVSAAAILVAPVRPGVLLRAANERRIRTG